MYFAACYLFNLCASVHCKNRFSQVVFGPFGSLRLEKYLLCPVHFLMCYNFENTLAIFWLATFVLLRKVRCNTNGWERTRNEWEKERSIVGNEESGNGRKKIRKENMKGKFPFHCLFLRPIQINIAIK